MLHLELPHINVLSKIDLLTQYGDLGILPFLHAFVRHERGLFSFANKQTSIWSFTLKYRTSPNSKTHCRPPRHVIAH